MTIIEAMAIKTTAEMHAMATNAFGLKLSSYLSQIQKIMNSSMTNNDIANLTGFMLDPFPSNIHLLAFWGYIYGMSVQRKSFHFGGKSSFAALGVFAFLLGVFPLCAGAASLDGVFDAGWTTAYQSADSINHMHQRLHALGMEQVVLQYAAVEKTHLYYPSELDFLQNTEYKNNQLFPKSINAAKLAGNKLWLGLYYDGENWYTPPTGDQLDTLAARNLQVLDELYALYGNEPVIEGVYIPQEIARRYWDGLRSMTLAGRFLIPVTKAAQAKGWKVMVAPFFNKNQEGAGDLQPFFESLFKEGFKPDVLAVQDGIGSTSMGRAHASTSNFEAHADTATVGLYELAIESVCKSYDVDFWVDVELFRTDDTHALASGERIVTQIDIARASRASKVIAYDLSVLGNAGLDSLEKWLTRDTTQSMSIKLPWPRNYAPRSYDQPGSGSHGSQSKSVDGEKRYYRLNGARVRPGARSRFVGNR